MFIFLLASFAMAQRASIQVQDVTGAPIAGAGVEVRSQSGVKIVLADAQGKAAVECAANARILVSSTGFETKSLALESCSAPVIVTLSPASVHTTLNVVVRDEGVATETSVTSAQIERTTARTAFDAVEDLSPSIFVTRRGVMGYGISDNGTGAISIRGVSGSPNTDVLIVEGGRPDFQGEMGHPLPDFYDLAEAGSISVIEGPASVLYGSNAMGGVVEITPRQPGERPEFRLTSSLGSYMTGEHRFSTGFRHGRGVYSLSANVSHTDGDRAQSGFRSQNLALGADYTLSNTWKLSVDGNYGHFMVDDPGPISAPLTGSNASVGRGGFSVDLANSTNLLSGYTRFYATFGHNVISDGFRSTDQIIGSRIQQTLTLPHNVAIDFGSDIVNYGGTARTVTSASIYGGDHRITDAAGFWRAHWAPIHSLLFNAGVRYQTNSQFGSLAVPEVSALWNVSKRLSWSATGSEGFRNPTLRELYLFPGPNPSLQPERLWNGESSLQYRIANNLQATVTYYYAHLNNQMVATGYWPNMLVINQGKANNRGEEYNLRWRIQRRISGSVGYAHLNSSNIQSLVPKNKATLAMDIDLRRAFLHLGVQALGKRKPDDGSTALMGSYTLASAKLSMPILKHYDLFVTVDNILDHKYQVLTGYPMPGVNAAGGFSIHF
jgi:iron complex outermembrane receptor protein